MNKEFEKAYIAYAGTPIPCLLCDGFSAEADKKRLQKFYEAGQQSAKPRWIPVTEKLPTEKDGRLKYDDIEQQYIYVIVKTEFQTLPCRFYIDELIFAVGGVVKSWQSLPEE